MKLDYETIIAYLISPDFCNFSLRLHAQKRKAEKAYASFDAGEYFDAIDLFKDAYSKTKKSDKSQQN